MKRKGFLSACLVTILATSLPAALPNPLPPIEFRTTPPDPTPAGGQRFTLSGTWPGTVTPPVVDAGTSTVQICIQVTSLDLGTLPAGSEVQVATVTIQGVPAS